MKTSLVAAVGALSVSAVLFGTAASTAAPAAADPITDALVSSLATAGIQAVSPTVASVTAQAVCTILSQPGGADVVNWVAESAGLKLGPAAMFTGIAISLFCPTVVSAAVQSALTNGIPAIPLPI